MHRPLKTNKPNTAKTQLAGNVTDHWEEISPTKEKATASTISNPTQLQPKNKMYTYQPGVEEEMWMNVNGCYCTGIASTHHHS